jgi:DUF1009 family protein
MSTSAPDATLPLHGAIAGEAGAVRLGIVAGGGQLPVAVARAALSAGFDPFILGLHGNADRSIEEFQHAYVHLGQVGEMFRVLRKERCHSIVLIGSLRRPNLFRLKFDSGLLRHLPRILRLFRGGDDTVLRRVARFFEEQGFEIRSAQDVAPRLLAPEGCFSAASPDAGGFDDIRLGFQVVRALGAFDIGQAAVVARKYVLAVEAAEGTDAMLQRCRELNRWGFTAKKGVLVKSPKPGQDLRLDLPAIGPRTVELAAAAGLAGIAVAAGAVLLAEQELLVEKAREHGVFLYGVSPAEITDG